MCVRACVQVCDVYVRARVCNNTCPYTCLCTRSAKEVDKRDDVVAVKILKNDIAVRSVQDAERCAQPHHLWQRHGRHETKPRINSTTSYA